MYKIRMSYKYPLLIIFLVFVVLCCFPSANMEVSANSTESAFTVGENLPSKSDAEMLWWNAILQQTTRTIHFPFPPAFDFYRPTTRLPAMDYSKPTALDGTFMQPASLGYKEIPAYFDEIRELGMDTVIIQYIRTKEVSCVGEDCCKSDDFHWLPNFPAKC